MGPFENLNSDKSDTLQGELQRRHVGLLSVQGLALLTQGQGKAGLAVGTITSAVLLLLDIKRAFDVGEPPAAY
jgi:hypothetical protein